MSDKVYAFPRMGYSYVGIKAFFDGVGVKVLIPPPKNQEVLELGVRYAPEDMCFPFKILLGQYIKVLEEGANVLVSLGGYGPCRFGYYMSLHEEILKDLGYTFETVVLEPLKPPWRESIPGFLKTLSHIFHFSSPHIVLNSLRNAVYKVYYTEIFERKLFFLIPREKERGSAERAFEKAIEALDNSGGKDFKKIKASFDDALSLMEHIEYDKREDLLKVGIIGEIYMVLDHDNNLDMEKKLAYMGVDVERSVWATKWIDQRILHKKRHRKEMMKMIKPYLGAFIGGDGQESLYHTILYKKRGYDGIIHILPFGCLPEITAKEILTNISQDYDIPVLSISFDEQTGEAGFITRIEAFIDLLWQRRGKGLSEIIGKI